MRARYWHHLETATDMAVGFVLNFVLVHTILHWLGYTISVNENLSMGVVLFFFSYIRKYSIRRIFNHWIKNDYANRGG